MHRIVAASVIALATACTCTESPVIDGQVLDLWGNPVENATIEVEGLELEEGQAITTNAQGMFELPMMPTAALKVTGEGLIPSDHTITVEDTEADYSTKLEVIPEPETEGLHLVGPESYLPLASEPVVRTGNELQTFHGVRSVGDFEVPGTPFRVVYHTGLRMDEVARLDIELFRLEFIAETEVATVEGAEEVDVNLWTASGKVKVAEQVLGSDDNYLFRVDDLPSGAYAFVSQDLLNPKNVEGFNALSPALRKVYTFTAK